MKHIAFVMFALMALPVGAQTEKPAAKEEAAKQEAVKPMAQAEKRKQASVGAPRIPHPRRWKEDARHCLDRATNTEVIKCAEEYL